MLPSIKCSVGQFQGIVLKLSHARWAGCTQSQSQNMAYFTEPKLETMMVFPRSYTQDSQFVYLKPGTYNLTRVANFLNRGA